MPCTRQREEKLCVASRKITKPPDVEMVDIRRHMEYKVLLRELHAPLSPKKLKWHMGLVQVFIYPSY